MSLVENKTAIPPPKKYEQIIARVSMSNILRFVWTYPRGSRRVIAKSCTRQLCLTSMPLLFKYFSVVESFRWSTVLLRKRSKCSKHGVVRDKVCETDSLKKGQQSLLFPRQSVLTTIEVLNPLIKRSTRALKLISSLIPPTENSFKPFGFVMQEQSDRQKMCYCIPHAILLKAVNTYKWFYWHVPIFIRFNKAVLVTFRSSRVSSWNVPGRRTVFFDKISLISSLEQVRVSKNYNTAIE